MQYAFMRLSALEMAGAADYSSPRARARSRGSDEKPGRPAMPATQDDLFAFLAARGIAVSTVSHPPLHTVEESRALRGEIAGAHTKNLFLKDRKDALFLVVAEENAAIDLKRLHEKIGASGKLSFGKPDLLLEVLGVTPGAVTAFGLINDTAGRVSVVVDATLMAGDRINCHPLVNTATTTIGRDDLIAFMKATGHPPKIVSFSGPDL
jgi:Ala-tRNA(Pro) deacylase